MEGISKEELIRVKENMPDGTSKLFVHTLITMCKELPDQQWQTIDEFKANPVDGWCWIKLTEEVGGNTEMAFSNEDSCFYENMDFNFDLNVDYITHVMPIKTPEAPK